MRRGGDAAQVARYRVDKGVVTPLARWDTSVFTVLLQLAVAYLFVWLTVRLIWRGVKAPSSPAPPASPS